MLRLFKNIQPNSPNLFESDVHITAIRLRICSERHAQLKSKPTFRTSIVLDRFARELSPEHNIQEFVERICSLKYSCTGSCWRQSEGAPRCHGKQQHYEIWGGLPAILIFEPEPNTSTNTFQGTL